MSVTGWADNQLEDSSISRVGIGLVSGPNKWKIWGVDIQFTPSTAQTGSVYSYSASSTATAHEEIPAVTVNSAGTISYSWSVIASVDTNLNVYSNTAAGSASALATADMQIGPVPTAVDGTGTVTP
ncbi:MAG: hypothetical protein NXI04_16060 [Planctomycetaceae bacterium]|nr:hypothetical protein [Planctomycetaceae bacterium]